MIKIECDVQVIIFKFVVEIVSVMYGIYIGMIGGIYWVQGFDG